HTVLALAALRPCRADVALRSLRPLGSGYASDVPRDREIVRLAAVAVALPADDVQRPVRRLVTRVDDVRRRVMCRRERHGARHDRACDPAREYDRPRDGASKRLHLFSSLRVSRALHRTLLRRFRLERYEKAELHQPGDDLLAELAQGCAVTPERARRSVE